MFARKTWKRERKKLIGNWQKQRVALKFSGSARSCISASFYLISNDVLQINCWLTVLEHKNSNIHPIGTHCIFIILFWRFLLWCFENENLLVFAKIENCWLSLYFICNISLCSHYKRWNTEQPKKEWQDDGDDDDENDEDYRVFVQMKFAILYWSSQSNLRNGWCNRINIADVLVFYVWFFPSPGNNSH